MTAYAIAVALVALIVAFWALALVHALEAKVDALDDHGKEPDARDDEDQRIARLVTPRKRV